VDLGLRLEEAASKNDGGTGNEKSEIDALGDLKLLWKNILSWSLESRYLARFLVESMPSLDKDKIGNILNQASEKSKTAVSVLLHEEV
jgi:hypothetical protein